jgi:glyoxylase-like metal-dependent hydrolase (beta-lactamase superfamily II)
VRAVGVQEDVLVVTSRVWQTNCTAVRAGGEAFVIDSPVLPDELEMLPAVLSQAGFDVQGLLCTHGDWDHLLARLAFPQTALGCAETTAARLAAEPGATQREMRSWDEQFYVERPRPLSLGEVQALPVPGRCELGDREVELHPADGHTQDGMALWIPWAGVLCAGDYLSEVEIPLISRAGSLDGYDATLRRLRPLVEQARTVVPGHGGVLSRQGAREILEADVAYLAALRELGERAELPPGRRTGEQRRIHRDNAGKHAAAAG